MMHDMSGLKTLDTLSHTQDHAIVHETRTIVREKILHQCDKGNEHQVIYAAVMPVCFDTH